MGRGPGGLESLVERLAVLLGEAEALLALLRGCRAACRGCMIAYEDLREHVDLARGILSGAYIVGDLGAALQAVREAVLDAREVLRLCGGQPRRL